MCRNLDDLERELRNAFTMLGNIDSSSGSGTRGKRSSSDADADAEEDEEEMDFEGIGDLDDDELEEDEWSEYDSWGFDKKKKKRGLGSVVKRGLGSVVKKKEDDDSIKAN